MEGAEGETELKSESLWQFLSDHLPSCSQGLFKAEELTYSVMTYLGTESKKQWRGIPWWSSG